MYVPCMQHNQVEAVNGTRSSVFAMHWHYCQCVLLQALVFSKLEYCSSTVAGLPACVV